MIGAAINSFKYILSHPLTKDDKISAIERFIEWQIVSRIRPRDRILYDFVNGSRLAVRRGQDSATANIYVGLSEFEPMAFALHLLREGDLFVDVGANVGIYTVLASAVRKAKTMAIEPIPSTFNDLMENISANSIQERVFALNIGIGSKNEKVSFTSNLGAMNRVAADGERAETVQIDVTPLDSVLNDLNPLLIKIDTEGYLAEIFKGADKTFGGQNLKAMIVEAGYDIDTDAALSSYGFKAFDYDPFSRSLTEKRSCDNNTAIYVRGVEFVQKRIRSSEKFKVLNRYL